MTANLRTTSGNHCRHERNSAENQKNPRRQHDRQQHEGVRNSCSVKTPSPKNKGYATHRPRRRRRRTGASPRRPLRQMPPSRAPCRIPCDPRFPPAPRGPLRSRRRPHALRVVARRGSPIVSPGESAPPRPLPDRAAASRRKRFTRSRRHVRGGKGKRKKENERRRKKVNFSRLLARTMYSHDGFRSKRRRVSKLQPVRASLVDPWQTLARSISTRIAEVATARTSTRSPRDFTMTKRRRNSVYPARAFDALSCLPDHNGHPLCRARCGTGVRTAAIGYVL